MRIYSITLPMIFSISLMMNQKISCCGIPCSFHLQYSHAKKYNDAIELINESFDELFYNARYELLFKWINLIPESAYNENMRFKFNKALVLKYYKSDNEGSYKIFSELLKNPKLTEKDDLYF